MFWILLVTVAACGPKRGCMQAGPDANCSYNRCGHNGLMVWGDLGIPYDQEVLRLRVEWCESGECAATELAARSLPGGADLFSPDAGRVPRLEDAGRVHDGGGIHDGGSVDAGGSAFADQAGVIRDGDLYAVVALGNVACGAAVSCPISGLTATWKLRVMAHAAPYEQTDAPPPVSYRLQVTDLDTGRTLVDFAGDAAWKREPPQDCPASLSEGIRCWHAYQKFEPTP